MIHCIKYIIQFIVEFDSQLVYKGVMGSHIPENTDPGSTDHHFANSAFKAAVGYLEEREYRLKLEPAVL